MFFRVILFGILLYLVIKLINQFVSGLRGKDPEVDKNQDKDKGRKVSKDVGEYVDYEDVD